MTRLERFIEKLDTQPKRGCWNWGGSKSGSGYGQFWDGVELIPAHYFLLSSTQKAKLRVKGMEACHKCDNKLCVRPTHIFIGTRADNVNDCVSKGRLRPRNGCLAMLKVRNVSGERNSQHKLTSEDVKEIRFTQDRHGIGAALAREYGVSQTVISGIRNGSRWKDS